MYKAQIKRLACMLALLFWSVGMWADSSDPFPSVNSRSFYGSMNITMRVMMDGEPMQNVVVAAYCGDEIRGKGTPKSANKPGVIYLTVYGNKSGEKLSFKVCQNSDGHIFEIDNGLEYTFNAVMGSSKSPYETEAAYGCVSFVKNSSSEFEVTIDGNITDDNLVTQTLTAQTVTYKRTFSTPYATICLPFGVSQADAAAAGQFYTFSGINDNYEVVMTEVTSGLSANTPYIVKPASTSTEVTFTYSGSVAFPLKDVPETSDAASGWSFKGAWNTTQFQGTPDGKAIYFFASAAQGSVSPGDFVKVNTESEKTKALPFRAYLEYTGSANLSFRKNVAPRNGAVVDSLPQSMKVVILNADGSTTEIGTVRLGDPDEWYDLSGFKLEGRPTESGLYINNGRKVLINSGY